MKVIGIRDVDYEKKDGRRVQGQEVVVLFTNSRYTGYDADKIWISLNTISHMDGKSLKINDEIEFTYGKDFRTGQAYVNGWRYLK